LYYIYMLRCEDNSIYTGITTDIKRRVEEHFERGDKCAKYTLTHHAKKLETVFVCENRKLASKLEYHIKRLLKEDKESLIKDPNNIEKLLGSKIDAKKYQIYIKK